MIEKIENLKVRHDGGRPVIIDRAALRGALVDHLIFVHNEGEREISFDSLMPDIFTDADGQTRGLTVGEALDLVAL